MYDENHTNWHVKYLMEKQQNVTLAPRPHTLCVDFLWRSRWWEGGLNLGYITEKTAVMEEIPSS